MKIGNIDFYEPHFKKGVTRKEFKKLFSGILKKIDIDVAYNMLNANAKRKNKRVRKV